ncbi:MAG: hypothetical protein M1508_06125 [Nitrospirae bacterium]|nr:hypothetical protein [Nitrospirota bacterium]MCL5420938.1 hypothetical protein [Nitrospirota bacterium]
MAGTYGRSRKKPVGKLIVMGIISIALYVILLSNQGVVNDYFSRGGLVAFLPIAVAFIFSIVHGSFTANFWTVLGIEAAKRKKEVK